MADEYSQGGMRGNMERVLAQRTPVDGTSPQTEEELAAYVQLLDWIKKTGGRGGHRIGGQYVPPSSGPLSSLLSQGQKVPAEQFTRNWPSGRQNPLSWLVERLRGSNVPGARMGQWMDAQTGKFATTPWRASKTLMDIPYGILKNIQGGSVPRELKSGQQIGRDAHSIVSAQLNKILGKSMEGEAWNSPARISAARKLGLLRGLPIAGAVGSAAYDTYRFATEPDYSMGEYGLDQVENATWLGGVGTGILGSGARAVGGKVWDSLKEGTSAFRNLTDLKKLKWILSQDYP